MNAILLNIIQSDMQHKQVSDYAIEQMHIDTVNLPSDAQIKVPINSVAYLYEVEPITTQQVYLQSLENQTKTYITKTDVIEKFVSNIVVTGNLQQMGLLIVKYVL